MTMTEIASENGVDVSTVSRVVNSKYVKTDFGLFLLRDLFVSSAKKNDGTIVSNNDILRLLQELVDSEDKKQPFSDQKISEILEGKGYKVARRTVAKYREALNIPTSNQRSENI